MAVNAGMATGICRDDTISAGFQNCDGCAIDQLQILGVYLLLQATAAFSLAALQQCLTDNCLFAAVTTTAPAVHSGTFAIVTDHGQHPEALSDKSL